MENYIGKICPYCKTDIKGTDESKVCPSCGIPHHIRCWEKNNGCTTFGCPATAGNVTASESKTVCEHCGVSLDSHLVFCPYCGTRINKGSDVQPPHNISVLNDKIKRKKKKKKTVKRVFISIFVVLILVALGLGAALLGIQKHWQAQVNNVIDGINAQNPSIETIKVAYQALDSKALELYRSDIVSAFIDMVSENVYEKPTEKGCLVDSSKLSQYAIYKEIAQILNIADASDKTNIVAHIDSVLALKMYEQYNGVAKCYQYSYEDCKLAISYCDSFYTSGSTTVFTLSTKCASAIGAISNALASARAHKENDGLCTAYFNAIEKLAGDLDEAASSISAVISTRDYDRLSRSMNKVSTSSKGLNQEITSIARSINLANTSTDKIPEIIR